MLSELEAVVCELQITASFHPGASDEKGGKICHHVRGETSRAKSLGVNQDFQQKAAEINSS